MVDFDVNKVRKDFPILGREVYGKPLCYLDSAATAQKPLQVIECEKRLYMEINANVHRGVHCLSEQMTEAYENSRKEIARFIAAPSEREIIFTSGATAALNTVAYSLGSLVVGEGDNVIVSEFEHHSNIVPWQLLCQRRGAQLRVLEMDDRGCLKLEMLDSLLDSRTRIVAVAQSSNTLGTRPDVRAIADKAHAAGALLVVDGCQGVVHGITDVQALGCDFYAFSGHKLYAPNGIGVLWGRMELLEKMPPFLSGGDMIDKVSFQRTTYAQPPLRFEAGTPNYIGAVCLAEAIHYIESTGRPEIERHEQELMQYAQLKLKEIEGLRIFGEDPGKAPLISFNVEGCDHYDMGMLMDKMGVAVRTGHHCADPVMQHFSQNGMCRASFGMYNTREDVDALFEAIRRASRMLKHR